MEKVIIISTLGIPQRRVHASSFSTHIFHFSCKEAENLWKWSESEEE